MKFTEVPLPEGRVPPTVPVNALFKFEFEDPVVEAVPELSGHPEVTSARLAIAPMSSDF
jgi:hypothetical protein